MNSPTDLAKMVPGFEFLQNLMKGAGASLPGVQGFGQWIAPTLDPQELEKRIQELKTVQFWLEQNARLLGTTIQALEVQRMTLSTLQTMNLPMADLRDALKARLPQAAPPAAPAPAPPPAVQPAPEEPSAPRNKAAPAPAPAAIDPMQWWGALTQQFTEIAAKAVKDSSADAARHVAGRVASAAVKQGMAAAGKTLAKAASLPGQAAKAATATAARATAPPRKR